MGRRERGRQRSQTPNTGEEENAVRRGLLCGNESPLCPDKDRQEVSLQLSHWKVRAPATSPSGEACFSCLFTDNTTLSFMLSSRFSEE